MGSEKNQWKRKILIALYIFAIANILVSAERIVFDALGQMWVILFANGITIIATLVCILGVLCKKNAAILAFIVCTVVALAVNVIIVLIFNDIGVFSDKDNYLSLNLNEKHWWRDHGFLCYSVCNHGNDAANDGGNNQDHTNGGSGGGDLVSLLDTAITVDGREYGSAAGVNIQRCFASYVVIETAHASLSMALMIITVFLSVFALDFRKKKGRKLLPTSDEDNDSFKYVGVGRYGGNDRTNPRQPSFYKLSDSFDLSSTTSTTKSK